MGGRYGARYRLANQLVSNRQKLEGKGRGDTALTMPLRRLLMLQTDHSIDLYAAIILQQVRVASGDQVKHQVIVGEGKVADCSYGSPIAGHRVISGQESGRDRSLASGAAIGNFVQRQLAGAVPSQCSQTVKKLGSVKAIHHECELAVHSGVGKRPRLQIERAIFHRVRVIGDQEEAT